MVATVSFQGFGRVSGVNDLTNVSAFKIAGSGGSPSAALADGFIQGTGAVTCTANKQKVMIYYTSGTAVNFTAGGNAEGQTIFIWANFLASTLLLTQANGGFGMVIGTDSANYSLYNIEGSDTYSGGWVRFAINPTVATPATTVGTVNLNNITMFGVFADVGGTTARFDNLILDAIDVGYGYKVTGTSTVDSMFQDVLDYEETAANRYGIVKRLDAAGSVLEVLGQLELGDTAGASSELTETDTTIVFANPIYYDGASVGRSMPIDFQKLLISGNAGGTTSVKLGKPVGAGDSLNGRNGVSILGNNNYQVSVSFDDGNADTVEVYGSSLRNISGPISWGTNTSHILAGTTVDQCSSFDPVGGISIRNTTFSNSTDVGGALVWNSNINIKNSNFINNIYSILFPTTGISYPISPSFTGMNFAGSDGITNYDLAYLGTTTSAVTINVSDESNPSNLYFPNSITGIVVVNTKQFVITNVVENSEIRILQQSDLSELGGVENVAASPTGLNNVTVDPDPDNLGKFRVTYSYNYTGDIPVFIAVHSENYKFLRPSFTLKSDNSSLQVSQVLDRQYI